MPTTPKKKTRINKKNVRVDLKSGKFVSASDGSTAIERWNRPGALGFAHWLNEIKPKILTSKNVYRKFTPTKDQATILKKVLAVDAKGNFKHSLSIQLAPRRMGKSVLFALVCLWLFSSRNNFTIQLSGNTEDHSRRVQYRLLKNIILNTPKLRLIIPDKNILMHEIKYPRRGNVIQMQTGVSFSTSFGMQLNLIWSSDAHAAVSWESFNALQSSLLDSEGSLCLMDCNCDSLNGPIHDLQKLAETDKSIYCNHTSYKDLDDYLQNCPPWIDKQKVIRLEKTLLEAEFKRDILGQRSSVINSLFPQAILDTCRDAYRCPVEDIKALVGGQRSYVIGGGLDRADSEWGSVFGNDNTIFTTVCKVAGLGNQEPEIFVLDQHCFKPSTGRAIKKHIIAMHKKYGFKNVTLEAHNVTDIQPYLIEQGVPCETVSPTSSAQNIAWPELVRIAKTGRLRISKDLDKLFHEMSTMTYAKLSTGNYKFSHQMKRKHKDDRPFSLLWSVYSLRNEVLQAFALGNVQCKNKSKRRHSCFIMGGSLELLCGEQCTAYQEVQEFYRQFMQYQTESTLTLSEFFHAYVTIKGAVLYQAA
jgi:hypothetical protein